MSGHDTATQKPRSFKTDGNLTTGHPRSINSIESTLASVFGYIVSNIPKKTPVEFNAQIFSVDKRFIPKPKLEILPMYILGFVTLL